MTSPLVAQRLTDLIEEVIKDAIGIRQTEAKANCSRDRETEIRSFIIEVLRSDARTAYELHLASICQRQSSIPGLIIDNGGLSAHLGGHLSLGCQACKGNKWVAVFVGKACNAKCGFCPQPPKPTRAADESAPGSRMIGTSFSSHDYSTLLSRLRSAAQDGKINAIGYSGGEPLLYLDCIAELASSLRQAQPSLYQYVYTNGLVVTEDKLRKLRDVGIQEVRFNLAATDFSSEVVRRMALSKSIVPYLAVEVPALKDMTKQLGSYVHEFIDIGVDFINLCEVLINKYNWSFFKTEPVLILDPSDRSWTLPNAEATVVSDKTRKVTPVWSRHVIYDVMETAYRDNWPVVINDCSQLNHYKPAIPY